MVRDHQRWRATVKSDGGERTDGGERRWSKIDGGYGLCKIFGENSDDESSGEVQEIWDSNSLFLNPWWNMLSNVLDKTPKIVKWVCDTYGCQSITTISQNNVTREGSRITNKIKIKVQIFLFTKLKSKCLVLILI